MTEYDTSCSDGSRVPSATGTAAGGGATAGSASTHSAGAHSAKAPNIHEIELERRKRLLAWTTAGQFARDCGQRKAQPDFAIGGAAANCMIALV
jgi:hypothetical protein